MGGGLPAPPGTPPTSVKNSGKRRNCKNFESSEPGEGGAQEEDEQTSCCMRRGCVENFQGSLHLQRNFMFRLFRAFQANFPFGVHRGFLGSPSGFP